LVVAATNVDVVIKDAAEARGVEAVVVVVAVLNGVEGDSYAL
jgi:hypothetical protein